MTKFISNESFELYHVRTKKILAEQARSARIVFWMITGLGVLLVFGLIFFLYETT